MSQADQRLDAAYFGLGEHLLEQGDAARGFWTSGRDGYGKPRIGFGGITNRLMGVESCSVWIVAQRVIPGQWFLFSSC